MWGLPVSGAAEAIVAMTVSLTGMAPARAPSPAGVSQVSVRYPAESLGRRTIERDPFRTARSPADLAYDPLRSAPAVAVVAAPPKPALVLTGIVWGTSAEAVLEGLPGVNGARVLRAGDIVSGLVVKRIEHERVTVVGMDTVWVLTVRQPWQQ
jgi:hypothetical protein